MTLATKNGSIIVKDGKLAENCGCCGGWYCYTDTLDECNAKCCCNTTLAADLNLVFNTNAIPTCNPVTQILYRDTSLPIVSTIPLTRVIDGDGEQILYYSHEQFNTLGAQETNFRLKVSFGCSPGRSGCSIQIKELLSAWTWDPFENAFVADYNCAKIGLGPNGLDALYRYFIARLHIRSLPKDVSFSESPCSAPVQITFNGATSIVTNSPIDPATLPGTITIRAA